MLYSYGVVEFEFLRTQICNYMNEIVKEDELRDLYFKRLSLNIDVNYYNVIWANINEVQQFVTYLNEIYEDVGYIVKEQKYRGLKYKIFKEQDVLNRGEYLWDKPTQKFYKYINSKCNDIMEYKFKRIIKRSEIGESIWKHLIEKCKFEKEEELAEFMRLFMEWYNNSPQYVLGGYSPIEFGKITNLF